MSRRRLEDKRARVEAFEALDEPCTTSRGHSQRCQNPLCGNSVAPIADGWRRTERRHCSDECKQQASIIKRAASLLEGLTDGEALKVLRGV
jgi:hypothetical protein